ncbi:polysaccharide export protein [Maribacter sp. SA7]|uniref:polysaccharide biosynthesis/export family protein n=1 Tax=Maribacter zhoushanensis TaxID=3030012 RepID=UPI0023EADFE8|nr:polysaccharide biosynthesis/export family protein [Maribacter zhoushanensis]MDF4201833.1 polysaccharide export protein [Maribacter zhoushanensis]
MKNKFLKTKGIMVRNAGIILFLALLVSCGNMKKSTYFYEAPDSIYNSSKFENLEDTLHENDLLSISVSSVNREAAAMFNTSNQVGASTTMVSGVLGQASGYLVDKTGNIRFPILGEIEVAGKTKQEVRDYITAALTNQKLLLEPIVDVRLLNFRVSVLGEVLRPNVFTVPSEKISVLEALSLAGDITIYGNKENVSLIREVGGNKVLQHLDLTSSDILSSQYFYLKSNDIIYVEPRPSKVAESSVVRPWIPVALSAISLAIIAIVNFK